MTIIFSCLQLHLNGLVKRCLIYSNMVYFFKKPGSIICFQIFFLDISGQLSKFLGYVLENLSRIFPKTIFGNLENFSIFHVMAILDGID